MNHIIVLVAQYALALPILFVGITITMRRRWTYDIVDAIGGGLLVALIEKLAGSLYHEARPFVALHLHPLIPHIADNSFPSDHLAATGLAVMYLLPRSRPLAIAATVVAIFLGAARIQAYLHWPLDIAVGFTIGIFGMLLGHVIVRKLFPKLATP